MRVLFATWEGRPHLFPAVPLAWSFYAAGHDVRVACQPDLVEAVVQAGLPAVAMGKQFDVAARVRQDPSQLRFTAKASYEQMIMEARRSFGLLAGYNDAIVDDLVDFTRRWRPDLVIWDPMVFVATVAARTVGVPDARLLWGPDLFMYRRQKFRELQAKLPAHLGENPVAEWLSGVFARFGMEPADDKLMGRWTIDPCPPSLRLPVECDRVPMRYIPYNGRAVMPGWLLDPPPRPRVCLTPGTSSMRLTGEDALPMADAIQALGKVDAEVVVAVTAEHRDLLTNPPANMRVVDLVSFHLLFPTCSAVIHHGGAGTTMTAAVHGVPQLVIPQVADQATNAQQITATGAAVTLTEDESDADSIRDRVTRLLEDPSYGAAAAVLRDEISRQPNPADVVRTLEQLIAAAG